MVHWSAVSPSPSPARISSSIRHPSPSAADRRRMWLSSRLTTLTAKTPAHAAGQVDVVVTTPSGSAGTGNGLYTYGTVPIVTAINPPTGPIAGNTSVTITGQNFTGATSVTIGGFPAVIGTVAATTITATTPAHAAGQADVVVTTPIGTGTGTKLYTYVVGPHAHLNAGNHVEGRSNLFAAEYCEWGYARLHLHGDGQRCRPAPACSAATGLVFGIPTALGAVQLHDHCHRQQRPAQTAALVVTGTIAGIVSQFRRLHPRSNPSFLGQQTTFTATETPNIVHRHDHIHRLDTATVLCNAVPIVSGFATCTVKFTTPGAHQIQATYPGSAQCLPSVSPGAGADCERPNHQDDPDDRQFHEPA